MLEHVYTACGYAASVWEASLIRVSWYNFLLGLAFGVAALLCFLNGYFAKKYEEGYGIWIAAVVMLLFFTINNLLLIEIFITEFVRAYAKLLSLYERRREIQYQLIALIAIVLFLVMRKMKNSFAALNVPGKTVSYGLTLLISILVFRTVSAHATDAVINFRVFGFTVGRIVELFGIGLLFLGATRCLRLRA